VEGGKSQGSFENIRRIYCVALPKAYKVLSWQFIFLAFRLLLAKARQFCKYHQGDSPSWVLFSLFRRLFGGSLALFLALFLEQKLFCQLLLAILQYQYHSRIRLL